MKLTILSTLVQYYSVWRLWLTTWLRIRIHEFCKITCFLEFEFLCRIQCRIQCFLWIKRIDLVAKLYNISCATETTQNVPFLIQIERISILNDLNLYQSLVLNVLFPNNLQTSDWPTWKSNLKIGVHLRSSNGNNDSQWIIYQGIRF